MPNYAVSGNGLSQRQELELSTRYLCGLNRTLLTRTPIAFTYNIQQS